MCRCVDVHVLCARVYVWVGVDVHVCVPDYETTYDAFVYPIMKPPMVHMVRGMHVLKQTHET